MKVILLSDVKKVGKKGDIVNVAASKNLSSPIIFSLIDIFS